MVIDSKDVRRRRIQTAPRALRTRHSSSHCKVRSCSWNAAAEKLTGYAAAEVLSRTCHQILKGKGALGTIVCGGECSVHQCAASAESIPTFDLEITTRSGSAEVGERFHGSCLRTRAFIGVLLRISFTTSATARNWNRLSHECSTCQSRSFASAKVQPGLRPSNRSLSRKSAF